MKTNKNTVSQKAHVKAGILIMAMLIQLFSSPLAAQESASNDHLSPLAAPQQRGNTLEVGFSIPLNKIHRSRQELMSSTSLYASYYASASDRQLGMRFSRNFGKNASFEYASLFRDSSHDIDISIPLYTSQVLNASSTGSTSGLSRAYLIGIGAGLLLLAAAGSGGGDEKEAVAPAATTTSWGEAALRRYEKNLSLPVCSPIPPADGNEEPCRNLL